MNILIINGSPHTNGTIGKMLNIMQETAKNKGYKVERIHANDLSIKPCKGCMVCRSTKKCVLPEDDAQRVLKMLQDSDVLIIGAPCYWGNIPGQLKLLFDRMVYGMMRDTDRFPEPLMSDKRCILISSCTTPWPFNILFNQSRGAIRALKEICGYAGIKIVQTIEKGGLCKHPDLSDKEIQKCRKAIERL